MKLLLLEFADDARMFLRHCKEAGVEPGDFLVVALQPEVKVVCKENRLDYTDTLDFFSNDSHRRALAAAHRLTELTVQALDFEPSCLTAHSWKDAFTYYYRFYLNNFAWIIEVMRGIREQYRDAVIHTVERRREVVPGGPFLADKDRFSGPLIREYCRVHGLAYEALDIDKRRAASRKQTKKPGLAYRAVKRIAGVLFKEILKDLRRSKTIFITTPTYHLDRVCGEITAAFPGVRCVSHLQGAVSTLGYVKLCVKLMTGNYRKDIFPVPVEIFEKRLSADAGGASERLKTSFAALMDKEGAAFSHDGCSLREELERKVMGDLMDHLSALQRFGAAQDLFLRHLKPRLILSPVSIDAYQGWAETGARLGIPALVIPQKGLVAPQEENARVEQHYIGRAQVTEDFQAAAAQTTLVNDYLRWAGYSGKILRTGNLIFSRTAPEKRAEARELLVPGITETTRIIVYAPSMKSRKSRRFFVLETLDELLASLTELVEAVSLMENVHLIVRIHPGEPIKKKEIEALLPVPANVSISDTGTFEEVLTAVDLLVSYSSTSIQEALINRAPVLLYDPWKRYNHLQAPRMETDGLHGVTAACYVDEHQLLVPAIRRMLEAHADKENTAHCFDGYRFEQDNSEFLEYVRKLVAHSS